MRERLFLLSTIYGDSVVGFYRAKNKSPSHRRGLSMDTRNSKFRQGFARKVREVESFGFGKCSWNFLGTLLAIQEVVNLPTLVYFPSRSRFGLG